jgi:hypothetical protein
MNLELSLTGGAAELTVRGEVFTAPVAKGQKPIVSDVIAAAGKISAFALPAGTYAYKYHVSAGVGAFTVAVDEAGTGRHIANDDEDTKFGFSGKTLTFEVP